ncbi:hypothetical protein HDU84_007397 [Entophlyctis sp. JEL0112]|nr:hypothetical protein HDU84_007397 [Entophlyctis sp. JEL0112]
MTKSVAQPLKRNFSLDVLYKSANVEPHIGTEFAEGIQVRDILNAPNSDELLLDLAVLVSERIVVFLRNQDSTFDEQKELVSRLGTLTGKPATSGLHSHPTTELTSELGEKALVISSERAKKFGEAYNAGSELASRNWHSDITFEPVPSDYAALKIRELPPQGGDTLWASAYEVYDRLSPAFAAFLEGLTATHEGSGFLQLEKLGLTSINEGPRGAPENEGRGLRAVHPVIRTNPVTGWKGVFVNGGFTKRINELSKDESDAVLAYLYSLFSLNHDLQVRFRWGKNDIALWDNRSSFHAATQDFDADEYVRVGERATSLGERPFFDPESQSRRKALGIALPPARRAHLQSLASGKASS